MSLYNITKCVNHKWFINFNAWHYHQYHGAVKKSSTQKWENKAHKLISRNSYIKGEMFSFQINLTGMAISSVMLCSFPNRSSQWNTLLPPVWHALIYSYLKMSWSVLNVHIHVFVQKNNSPNTPFQFPNC